MWGDAFIKVEGKRLECGFWGDAPPDGRAIVLLHEGLGCVALWRDFPAKLHAATGLPVMAYSRAGHGQSDPADLPRGLDWMTVEALGVLPSLLQASGVTQPVYVGHSDGASIAAICAGSRPETHATILMAPHFFTEDMGIAEIARVDETFRATDLATRMAKYHRDPVATFRGWADVWLDPEFRKWNIEAALSGVQCPLLAVQGRQDQYGTLAQIDSVQRNVAHAEVLVLEDCQHVPHLEQPAVTCEAIAKFVQNNA